MDSQVTKENEKKAQFKQPQIQQPQPKAVRTEPTKLQRFGRIGQWFQMICFMNIPVFGFFYMLVLAIRKSTPSYKRTFAFAYILYRILVLVLAVTILFVLYQVGLSFIDDILKYAGAS